VISCARTGKHKHDRVVLSTPLRPWTPENGDPAVATFGEWPASQEREEGDGWAHWALHVPEVPAGAQDI
jgi:hypothetical protein